jgi:Flp pilus assembly pilin Flp
MKTLREIYERFAVRLHSVLCSEKGQTLVEYGLLLVLVAVLLIMIVRGTGQTTNCIWSKINSGLK